MTFFVYLLECRDHSYYCGYTNDLPKRILSHNSGTGGRYTRSHRPVTLVHAEKFATRKKALAREHEIKKFTRKQKQSLVSSFQNKKKFAKFFTFF